MTCGDDCEKMNLTEIDIRRIGGFRIGDAQNRKAMTGVTAIVFDTENVCGVDISGGGPASRESALFSPYTAPKTVNALLLSGGSAYGLAAAGGAMKYLEERGKGYKIRDMVVPIVPQACIFDLAFGARDIRPDIKMGYAACLASEKNEPRSGIVGGGTGATVGKFFGMARAQKCGIGYKAFQIGRGKRALKVGAVVVVNAFGDVYDYRNGQKIAGALTADRSAWAGIEAGLYEAQSRIVEGENTTIGAVITNGIFSQQEMCRIAKMTRAALGRSINPVGTSGDGDTIYAISVGADCKTDPAQGVVGARADVNVAGVLACRAVSEAIIDAVQSSKMSDRDFLKYVSN